MVIVNYKNNYNSNKDNLINKVKFLFLEILKSGLVKFPQLLHKSYNDEAFNFIKMF